MKSIRVLSRRPNDWMNPKFEWRYRSKMDDVNYAVREDRMTIEAAEYAARTVISGWQRCEPHTEFMLVWE